MRSFLGTLLMVSCLQLQAQDFTFPSIQKTGQDPDDFLVENWFLLDSSGGDLNKDGLKDLVLVLQYRDTIQEKRPDNSINLGSPRILLVLFKEAAGYRLVTQDTSFITRYGEGGMSPDAYDGVEIIKGILFIKLEHVRSFLTYKFRYQQNDFYLIGFRGSFVYSAASRYDVYDINFMTRKYSHEWGGISDEKSKLEWKKLRGRTVFSMSDLKMPYMTRLKGVTFL